MGRMAANRRYLYPGCMPLHRHGAKAPVRKTANGAGHKATTVYGRAISVLYFDRKTPLNRAIQTTCRKTCAQFAGPLSRINSPLR